ncbi:RNA polymerase-binding transcription factor DksA [Ralstonia condita]|uniref:RNA polymerase-binding transcription factor DksA n=2 Tax=Ralstonia condita TaxID=3058600 RepID=A0ABN9IDW5_9RALS|nr:RNA polymerase-binding transcription factor DksA [Ralstonia sp. LMG 7141]
MRLPMDGDQQGKGETGMTHLTDAQWKQLNALLDEHESRVRRQLAGVISSAPPPMAAEPFEDADLAAQETSELAGDVMLAHYRQELADIEASRKRMREHRYGVCVDCGDAIPFLRLQAQPTAERCVACQAARERHWA